MKTFEKVQIQGKCKIIVLKNNCIEETSYYIVKMQNWSYKIY